MSYMRKALIATAFLPALGASDSLQEIGVQSINNNPNAAFLLSSDDVAAYRAKLQNVAYANITIVERPEATSPSGVAYRMAIDRRRPPQRAAAHASEGELWAIVDGSGEITTGGRIVETKKGDSVERRIDGGTVHKVSKGDFLLVPEGVPHQVTGFSPELYMVTLEIPRGVKR